MVLKLDTPIVFANYLLGETEISRTAAVHSEDSLLFVAGNKVCFLKFALIAGGGFLISHHFVFLHKMFKVPSTGPGCAHFLTCPSCQTAPDFMKCGWCSGNCSRKHECASQWNEESCAPVITEVAKILSVVSQYTEFNLNKSECWCRVLM